MISANSGSKNPFEGFIKRDGKNTSHNVKILDATEMDNIEFSIFVDDDKAGENTQQLFFLKSLLTWLQIWIVPNQVCPYRGLSDQFLDESCSNFQVVQEVQFS